MERNGVIKRNEEPADMVKSLILVEKPDRSLRTCLNPRDLNKAIKREHYQLPTFDEIASRITGEARFTNLDANKGYWQIPQSSKLTTTNTPYGRYCFLRLPYGLHSGQEVFHKRISQEFEAMDGIETDIDDFLIWAKDDDEHDKRLIECLEKARKIGLTLNSSKCQFRCDELTYLRHTISKDAINADASKIGAITEKPMPENKKAVQRLLEMISYVRKFIPNLAELTKPLIWHRNKTHEEAVNKIKKSLVSRSCLAFFDPSIAIKIQVDASKSRIGAVLMQNRKPVSYLSRSLANPQKNYPIIEKELLAVLFGCEIFHQFVYRSEVTIISDHKPLESIM